ncbi:AAA family ATPase [Candidatus Parvarchaeota archaeon]|uniref:AAA family ATPase n=1 Tax=Candidatus Acidifodinimicrobium mancum TaxID=2898728 RepID=A0A8T3V0S5_9ARCH|nr:AAA family ATPase [Candidatus Acidifodinimicrobium mancum]
MIIFSSAVAGSDRIKLENRTINLAKRDGKRLEIINLIDEMVKVANKTNPYIDSRNLPNQDIENIRILKDSALQNIREEINKNPGKDYIIDGHMSFWWKDGPLSLISTKDIKVLNPDFFITVVNDPKSVNDTLHKKKSWEDKSVDEYQIALWSELEIYTADLVGNSVGKKNYIIGAKEDPRTLFELMYKNYKPKAYISYSMEHRKSSYKNLNRFIERIRKYLIVFDPKSVDIDAYKTDGNVMMKNMVFNQTVRRDFHFVDQSDITIIYMSDLVYSSGVDGERMHAHYSGKKVLLYFPFERYSPFTPYFVDKMYNSEEELIEEIKRLAKRYKEKGKT